MPKEFILVENYLEAAGLVASMRAGVSRRSVLRPIPSTCIDGVPWQNINHQRTEVELVYDTRYDEVNSPVMSRAA
jgi:hypothetical protein